VFVVVLIELLNHLACDNLWSANFLEIRRIFLDILAGLTSSLGFEIHPWDFKLFEGLNQFEQNRFF
jgi:hypothetical protein